MSSGETIEARIHALASGGSCIGTVTEPETLKGKKVFVPNTIPGELIKARIVKQKRSHLFGELADLIEPAKERQTPPCPYFVECGGCDLQHINIQSQRELKRKMIEDTLRIQFSIEAVNGVQILGEDLPAFYYRRRISLHMNRDGKLGFYKKSVRHIIEIDQCMIATDNINKFIKSAFDNLKQLAPEVDTITIEDRDSQIFIVLELHNHQPDGLVTLKEKPAFKKLFEQYPTLQVNFHRKKIFPPEEKEKSSPPVGHFSQNNELANELMIKRVVELVKTPTVTDMYAGAGNLSIPLAVAGRTVKAVELNPALVAHGKHLAEEAGVSDRLTFYSLGCEKWVEKNAPDATLVLDPPRSGAVEVVDKLNPSWVNTVIYVSCYPPTFARDAQILVKRGYIFESLEVLDMFPQTFHAEVIGVFRAKI